uniref:Uncharacterized protein n=1 Tax=Ciona intestinalis TaxID=7719 RepID=H2XQ35_CIOIN
MTCARLSKRTALEVDVRRHLKGRNRLVTITFPHNNRVVTVTIGDFAIINVT